MIPGMVIFGISLEGLFKLLLTKYILPIKLIFFYFNYHYEHTVWLPEFEFKIKYKLWYLIS